MKIRLCGVVATNKRGETVYRNFHGKPFGPWSHHCGAFNLTSVKRSAELIVETTSLKNAEVFEQVLDVPDHPHVR